MGRPPCCDKSNVKRGPWTAEEDVKLIAHISKHGNGNWTSVPKKAGLKRCGKSCRLRWTNYLRPDLKHESFTPEEEELIITLHSTFGSRWSIIANQLPGRTDNDVKNYWNTKLKKKLVQKGIDPVTHKPISQIFGSIGGLSRGKGRADAGISGLNRDLRSVFMSSNPPQLIPQPPHDQMGGDNIQPTACWDLLSQLHAIKLVADVSSNFTTNGFVPFNHFSPSYDSCTPSSSSTAASSAHHQEDTIQLAPPPPPPPPPPAFDINWSDFLLDDIFLPSNQDHFRAPASMTIDSSSSYHLQDDVYGSIIPGWPEESREGVALAPEKNVVLEEYQDNYASDQNYGAIGGVMSDLMMEASSLDNSFVDSLLNHDSNNETSWDFSEFLADPFQCP